MNKFWTPFAIIMLMCLMGVGFWLGFISDVRYSGKETFYSEETYTEFKMVLSNPNIEVEEVYSLSSQPPIIVTFTCLVPRNIDFEYGNKDNAQLPVSIVLIVIGAGGIFATIPNLRGNGSEE